MKEKIFGQTICVKPNINEAFDSFVELLKSEESQGFVRLYRETILDIFYQSGEESLRILKHLLEDIGRAYGAFSKRHLKHEEAMRQWVALFSAFDIEVRAGRLQDIDLKDRYRSYSGRASREEREEPPFPITAANEKFSTLNLADELLGDDLLIEMLVNGVYNYSKIQASLDNSRFFVKATDSPPWKRVMLFDELEDGVVNEAILQMEKQFNGREVDSPGEMLHIFALRLMMVEQGEIQHSAEDEVEKCKRYIDDILEQGKLPSDGRAPETRDGLDGSPSYGGYGYWGRDNPHFLELQNHLIEALKKAFEKKLPDIAEDILKVMKENPEALIGAISYTGDGPNAYANIPVLHALCPEKFVETWLSIPRKSWREINYALQNRYYRGTFNNVFGDELEWARQVHKILHQMADKAGGLKAYRIRRLVPGVFKRFDTAQSN